MAVKGTKGKEIVSRDIKFFTGVAMFNVIAINPTKEELNKIGINIQNEISYVTDKTSEQGDQYRMVRVDVWLNLANLTPEQLERFGVKNTGDLGLRTKVSFFIEERPNISKDGTLMEYINHYGRSVKAQRENPSFDGFSKWFSLEGVRPAYNGEGLLMFFIRTWLNCKSVDQVFIDNWKAIFNGDFSELQSLVKEYPENPVNAMLTVSLKDGKTYQTVYNQYFTVWNKTKLSEWSDHINKTDKQGKRWNLPFKSAADGRYSYEFVEFNPGVTEPDPEPIGEDNTNTVIEPVQIPEAGGSNPLF